MKVHPNDRELSLYARIEKLEKALLIAKEALTESTHNDSFISRVDIEATALQKCEDILK